ncbi:MAG: hypothetical protein KAI24_24145 [Planctomycetes bacterium]|nr:hypothetical protein [Planctomycetota bacterium]
MCRLPGWSVAFVSLVVLAGAVASQQGSEPARDADRGAVLGWVEDERGDKRAGAVVVLVARPVPARADIGELDRVEVETDQRGRFRAACLRGRGYSAWAHWRDGDVTMVTAIVEGVVPGPPVRLHQPEPFAAPTLRFAGFDAWREHGPLRVVARPTTDNTFEVPLELVDDRARLPLLPGVVWNVEVRTRQGLLLLRQRASRGVEVEVRLPAPVAVEVRVRDGNDQPVAAATVASMPCYSVGGRDPRMTSTPVAQTDADGVAKFVLPELNALTGRRGSQVLRVAREGFATRLVVVPARGARRATLVMDEGFAVSGRLVDAAGEPIADQPVHVDHPVGIAGGSDARFGAPLQTVRTDADGRFVQHGLVPREGCRVMLALSPQRARALGFAAVTDRSLAPVAWIAARTNVTEDVELGTIRLSEVPMCRLQVVRHSGEPATEARVRLVHDSGYDATADFVTDRVGRLQFAYPDEHTRVGVFVPGGGVALFAVAGPASHELRVELSEPRVVTGRVVDEHGKPVANASVRGWATPQGMDLHLGQLVSSSFEASEPTGEDGRFRLTLPLGELVFPIRATAPPRRGSPSPRVSRLTKLAPDVDEIELVVH